MRTYSAHISVLLISHMAVLARHLYCVIISPHEIRSGDSIEMHVCPTTVSNVLGLYPNTVTQYIVMGLQLCLIYSSLLNVFII